MDYLGVSLSFLCIVHCILTPILLILAPIYHVMLDQFNFHADVFIILLAVAVLTLLRGYRLHRRGKILVYGGIGLTTLFVIALVPHTHETYQTIWIGVVNSIGSLFLIAAHMGNVKACRVNKKAGEFQSCPCS